MENDVYDLTPKEKPDSSSYKKKIEISYYQARFTQKCGAILLDFVIFAFLALALFIGAKGIVEATPYFQEVNQKYDEARLDSCLYIENKDIGRIEDVVTYLNRKTNMSTSEKETFLYDRINGFLVSVPEKTDYLTDIQKLAKIKQESPNKYKFFYPLIHTYLPERKEIYYYILYCSLLFQNSMQLAKELHHHKYHMCMIYKIPHLPAKKK